ncbi:hypothetical protein BDP27DRAFT_1360287 [Rhodocollybia butyracea]|uniref:Uncharacterized protein n=1 Tax=Rhodocollybia butyracea TaxID=206335 RepID=A0A9P5UAS1_9AGAR|nr:hypothetical protein BDP27DRAFT_1360287 [Rhodocollybia butyracea]
MYHPFQTLPLLFQHPAHPALQRFNHVDLVSLPLNPNPSQANISSIHGNSRHKEGSFGVQVGRLLQLGSMNMGDARRRFQVDSDAGNGESKDMGNPFRSLHGLRYPYIWYLHDTPDSKICDKIIYTCSISSIVVLGIETTVVHYATPSPIEQGNQALVSMIMFIEGRIRTARAEYCWGLGELGEDKYCDLGKSQPLGLDIPQTSTFAPQETMKKHPTLSALHCDLARIPVRASLNILFASPSH